MFIYFILNTRHRLHWSLVPTNMLHIGFSTITEISQSYEKMHIVCGNIEHRKNK